MRSSLLNTGATACMALVTVAAALAGQPEPPTIPVGLDAYRQWDRWAQQRLGARAYMRSTYDRRGGNEGADASHFLYQLAEDRNVTLDVQGRGILYFARYNHWHGSPWHYEVDGRDYLVRETSTATPDHPATNSTFLPQQAFPEPLACTWSETKGADLSWVPVMFENSFRMAYSRTHYGTGYYIYHQYVPGVPLSRSIRSWKDTTRPDRDVLELISRAGSDLLPPAGSKEARKQRLESRSGDVLLQSAEGGTILELHPDQLSGKAGAMVRSLQFTVPRSQAVDFGRARLRITWDGASQPSVDAPVGLFFGAGTLYNRDNREFLVKAFPVNIRFDSDKVCLSCFFPMPFFRSARVEMVNPGGQPLVVHWSLRWQPYTGAPASVGQFHATYRDHGAPEPGKDLVLLDTREAEGGGDWSGQLVGTSWIFSHGAVLGTLEGDPRFFFDDSQSPQSYGTGTEEWGGGGDYWGGRNMTLAFAGHPTGAPNAKSALDEEDQIESAYRFLLGDMMPFGKNAIIRLEHGGKNDSTEHYETVAFWYGRNRPSLVKSDELKIGDSQSEAAHSYSSPDASYPYEVVSRYELGVDNLNGKEIYPAQSDTGRRTTGVSEFTCRLSPGNFGVLLRRKLDYQFPNQRAEVFVADVMKDGCVGKFKLAGTWYLAGGNTCVYSNPKPELGAAQHVVQTSNRRFRDDEFLVPRKLTEGRSQVRVRVRFTPVNIPLFPGQPLAEVAWTEFRYDVYCFVMPE